jgi:outer membrane lipoprotein-sorting protein
MKTCIAFLLLFPMTIHAQQPLSLDEARPIVEQLQRGMSTLQTVNLEFVQERHLSLFTEPLRSEGVMFIEKPDRIRWETTSPYQSILLGDHKSVAQFEWTNGSWKKLHLGFPQMLKRVMEQMTLLHQGKLDALTSDYTVSVQTGSVAAIVLTPKDANVRSMLESIEMRMDPDFKAVREILMKQPGGDFTSIVIQNEQRNMTFPVGTFDQNKPLNLATVEAALRHAP